MIVNTVVNKKNNIFYILGKAILMASMQFAIGSVEMSSKFSVKNFSKDQETLDNAVDALRDYIIIGTLWTIGTSLIFYVNYGYYGLTVNILSNLSIILWIYISYQIAFKSAAKKYNLYVKEFFKKIPFQSDNHIVITGCVYNCATHLEGTLQNMIKLGKEFESYNIIIAFDESTDNSEDILTKWSEKYPDIIRILKGKKQSNIRTENICNARNRILEELRKIHSIKSFKYFIMMDCDEMGAGKLDIKPLREVLEQSDKWDSVSFSREIYYDIWALSFEDFCTSCWHFGIESFNIVQYVKNDMHKKFKDNLWFKVYSAFNGLAIYKTSMFLDLNYDWKFSENKKFITPEMMEKQKKYLKRDYSDLFTNQEEDCEHRNFHFKAFFNRNAKIYIYSKPIIS